MNPIIIVWTILGVPFLVLTILSVFQGKWILSGMALIAMCICALCGILHNKIYQQSGKFWP